MTDTANNLRMPDRVELIRQAIKRLDVNKTRVRIVGLSDDVLEGLCLALTDRDQTDADAHRWLEQEIGPGDVAYKIVNRFGHHFRPVFDQVRREHANRIARLSVESATAGNVDAMHRVANARLIDLVTEKLVETDSLEQMTGTELSATIATIDGITKAQLKREELALKIADAERKAAKLESDLATERLRRAELQSKLDRQVKEFASKATETIAAAEATAKDGGGAEAVVARVREILKL